MREAPSPDGRPRRRPEPRTVALTAAAVLLALAAAPVGVTRALGAHQPLTALAVGAVTVLWLIAVGLAALGAERSRALAEDLAAQHQETMTALVAVGSARQAEAAARELVGAAQTERDAARAERARAEAEVAAMHTELARLRAEWDAERAEAEAGRAQAEAERAELDGIAEGVLPEVVKKLRGGAAVDSALAAYRKHPQYALLRAVGEEIGRGERLRAAALAVCATAAGRVQALATSMHAELREMQHRHDEEVLGDLLRLDHSTAQAGRMADSIAVLTGARSGRRWAKPIAVESVLRGALGRIGAYQRVRLHNASTAAVAGFAAEGIMHALAELLDNATNFSAPPAEVHVYVEEVPAGLAVTVEDSGLGLGESWLRRAERAVSAEPLDLTTLSAGTRLGLAVVGVLARKHGLQISFRPSARGGTGVVMLIPQQLVSHPAPESAPAPVSTQAPAAESARPALTSALAPALSSARPAPARSARTPLPPAPQAPAVPAVTGAPAAPAVTAAPAVPAQLPPAPAQLPPAPARMTDSGLPQRRRGQTLAVTAPAAAPAAKPVRSDAVSAAARFGAFRRAAARPPEAEQHAAGAPTTDTDTTPDASPVTEKDSP
ncbi:histidine kinase/DNA gyrase B/HSP90-like ATPase [Streptomyces sp. 1114.5]|uniref:sensor histidine kinase n=1 Tax=Streptomyces sp. 1114.5 TaxID=1938830 RepID=UPI000F2C3CEF|nr:ATP-binding protein [Streptomyces sp. 1114.5]RKT10847.1 histidine kinase/DNA gyrase B/HSP90-like ATPase [Streptomyces sp. 1114.5]